MNLLPVQHKQRILVYGFLFAVLALYVAIVFNTVYFKSMNDFALFYHSAYAFFHGQNIYSPIPLENYHPITIHKKFGNYSHNLTPPVFTLLTLPLGLLGPFTAYIVWVIFSLLLNFFAIHTLYKIFFKEYHQPLIYWLMLSLYLCSMCCLANNTLGQVGAVLLFAVLWLWIWSKKQLDVRAGLLLGVLLSVKYFLGLIALLFFLQKRWRLLAYSALSFIGINGLALGIFGLQTFKDYIQNMHHIIWYANNWNASLFGFLTRFGAKEIHDQLILFHWNSFAYYFCSLLLVIGQIIICRKPFKTAEDYDYAFSYTIIASLLISPLGWLYYLTLLIIPILFIIRMLTSYQSLFTIKVILAFLFMMIFLNCPSFMQDTIYIGWHNLSLLISNLFYALLLLLGLLLYCKKNLMMTPLPLIPVEKRSLAPWVMCIYLPIILSYIFFAYKLTRRLI